MRTTQTGDPRLQALFGASGPRDASVRPKVRLSRRRLPLIAYGIIPIILGLPLFLLLNERRVAQVERTDRVQSRFAASAWPEPPPLVVPFPRGLLTVPEPSAPEVEQKPSPVAIPAPGAAPSFRDGPAHVLYQPEPITSVAMPRAMPDEGSGGAPLVIDVNAVAPNAAATAPISATSFTVSSVQPVSRMRASALAHRSMTVPQGQLISAVMETGFDSTKPGFARAIVSRDVRGFDGENVLIPRGSRLIGNYQSDVGQGQRRAIIIWSRLIRPDGMTITIDSPAVDTLGRGGIPASVNTHFFARFRDALLQTTVGLGGIIAQRSATPVMVIPNAASSVGNRVAPSDSYVPTLTVPPGKSISVFVAHDLDFSAVEGV